MYRCLPKKHDPSRILLITGIILTIITVVALYRDKVDFHNAEKHEIILYTAFAVFSIIILIAFLLLCINNYLWGSAYYRLTDEGICIKKKFYK